MSYRELFRINAVPAYQNKMYVTREAALSCPTGDVVLVQDSTSGLVHNVAYDPHLLIYDESYQNEQGLSSTFRAHVNSILDIIQRNFGQDPILEVGCGKGAFVELMRERGLNATGIDPAYEGNSQYIAKRQFDSSQRADSASIVLRHVLEHIPDPMAFLREIAAANGGEGKIYIEVPCLEWIIREKAWFDIFYEHVNYFCLGDFHRMFSSVIEVGHVFGGQYIFVVAELKSLRTPVVESSTTIDFPPNFMSRLDNLAAGFKIPKRRAIWGAAAKGVMFSHHLLARGIAVDFAIDINPAKQGRFLAGCGLAVLSPTDGLSRLTPGSDIFVMNSNYLDEISRHGGDQFNYFPADSQ